ncbi:MAG: HVO_0476 family zinc finger protein [Thermoplasmata archaeon]
MGAEKGPRAQGSGVLETPGGIYLKCPECGRDVLHEVLKGRARRRGGGIRLDALVKCGRCGCVRRAEVREEAERMVPAVLSDAGASERRKVPLDPSASVSVGDELVVDGLRCLVTSIEAGGARRSSAKVPEICTLWLKRFDRVRVRVSVNAGRRTLPREFWAPPEKEVAIGDVVEAGGVRVLVHSMSVGGRKLRKGSAKARDIVRIYGREVE